MDTAFLLSQTADASELLVGIDSGERFILLIVVIGVGFGLILGVAGIVSGTVNAIHRRRVEVDLKREMIERGMSADEIAKIIESSTPPEDATWVKKKC